MKYFLFEDDASAARVYSTINAETGVPLSTEAEQPTGVYNVEVQSGSRLCDRLFSIGKQLILSKRASDVIRQHRLCPSLKWVEVNVVTADLRFLGVYEFWYSLERYDVLDVNKAEIKYLAGKIPSIRRWALNPALVPHCDFFLAKPNAWFVSDAIAGCFQKYNLTGVNFVAVEQSIRE
jgi:hypothetical protein